MRNRKHDGNKSSVVNFGVQGWVTILYCLLMFWLYAGMVNSGSNVTAPAIAEKFGILPGTVLNMNTVAGVVGVIFFIVVGQINRVIGARITSGVCLIVAGLAYLGVGNAVNLAMYTVCMCIVGAASCLRATSPAGIWSPSGSPRKKASSWATPPWATIWPPSPLSPLSHFW